MAQPLRRPMQTDGNHAATAGITAQPNGISSASADIPEDLQANDNIENGTIGSGTLNGSSVDDDDEFPPLIPGPDGIHIFIERDYRFTPRLVFPETMPSDLLHIEGLRVDQPRFEALIRKLNVIYAQTEHVGCMSVVETLVQMTSCYTSLLCCRSQYRRYIDQADRAIANANDEWRRNGVPLFMLSPRERGMRCLELIAMPPLTRNGTSTLTTSEPPMAITGTNGRSYPYPSGSPATNRSAVDGNNIQANLNGPKAVEIATRQPHSTSLAGSNGGPPSIFDGQYSGTSNTANSLHAKGNSLRSESIELPHNADNRKLKV